MIALNNDDWRGRRTADNFGNGFIKKLVDILDLGRVALTVLCPAAAIIVSIPDRIAATGLNRATLSIKYERRMGRYDMGKDKFWARQSRKFREFIK
jgi:hypothetical protein